MTARTTARLCIWSAPLQHRVGAGATRHGCQAGRADGAAKPARWPGPARLPRQPGRTRVPARDSAQITARGGDSVLALKGNQTKAHAEVKRWFEANAFSVHGSLPCFDAFDEGHGRLVRRRAFACTKLDPWTTLQRWPRFDDGAGDREHSQHRWLGQGHRRDPLLSVRRQAALNTTRYRHPQPLGDWVLDVGFNEDASRVRERTAARNLALLRKIALNFARANTTLEGRPQGQAQIRRMGQRFHGYADGHVLMLGPVSEPIFKIQLSHVYGSAFARAGQGAMRPSDKAADFGISLCLFGHPAFPSPPPPGHSRKSLDRQVDVAGISISISGGCW